MERYYHDSNDEEGDPWRLTRKWSISDITFYGLDSLKTIFEFDLEGADEPTHLLNEVGLLVAFVMDGDCRTVKQRHKLLADTFLNGKNPRAAIKTLEKTIAKAEKDLLEFAGL